MSRLGLPQQLFPKLSRPGTVIGQYEGIKIALCATHDTGSAVEGIPMEGDDLYISSGTWSLLGVKTPKPLTDENSQAANYSNEGGVGYIPLPDTLFRSTSSPMMLKFLWKKLPLPAGCLFL